MKSPGVAFYRSTISKCTVLAKKTIALNIYTNTYTEETGLRQLDQSEQDAHPVRPHLPDQTG